MRPEELAARLKEVREQSGVSQGQLAYQVQHHGGLNVSQQQVAWWETKGTIRATELATIAMVLDVPVAEFYKPPSANRIRF